MKKQIHRFRELVVTSGEGGGAIYGWGSGTYKLLGVRDRLQGCIVQHGKYIANIL